MEYKLVIKPKALDELEDKLERNFNNPKTFDICIQWYRRLRKYISEFMAYQSYFDPYKKCSDGTYMFSIGEIGSFTYLIRKGKITILDFYFEDFGILEYINKFNSLLNEMDKGPWK